MRADRIGERLQVIAAFQSRDHTPTANFRCNFTKLCGEPFEISGGPVELRQRVAVVSVETSRDKNHLWFELAQARENLSLVKRAHVIAATFGWDRKVDDIIEPAFFAAFARSGPERHLLGGDG